MIPLAGYADRFSLAPGETLHFKISSSSPEAYQARLVRVICGDPNPAGPGIKEEAIDADFAGSYPSRQQSVPLGSYGLVNHAPALNGLSNFSVAALIWPTTPEKEQQGIVTKFDSENGTGFALFIDANGAGVLIGSGQGKSVSINTGKPLRERAWYRIWASYDSATQKLSVGQQALQTAFKIDDSGKNSINVNTNVALDSHADLLISAFGGTAIHGHYNGKIERPLLLSSALQAEIVAGLLSASKQSDDLVACWDFAHGISTKKIHDIGPHGLHGELLNLPARAMKGASWNGAEMCWRHAPEQYAAIHFHDDDLYDCGWATDFSFSVPDDFASGVYAARLQCGPHQEMIPFIVRPARGKPQSNACVLIPAFTYIVYGNYARDVTDATYLERVRDWDARPWTADEHRDFSLSTYNYHNDGSGICYGSRLRPMITMRSGFLAYFDPRGSGLRHFPADTHLLDWLNATGHDVDIITDEDLQAEGSELIAPYKAVLTTTHPEYQTKETLDALQSYTHQGGHLMYLGGNGFYWRVAVQSQWPGAVEIRRGEGGIRAWAAEPGEYYHSFDGQYGGLWRRNDRPPQQLAGVGFTSQGRFEGSYYRRRPEADDPRVAWIFAGVDDEILGNFGLSGGGAGGFELDRADRRLGTPAHARVLATSEGHDLEKFVPVHEEQLTDVRTLPGEPANDLIRADMVYFETANGGAVFSVGSITFCGSLAHNDYDNNISRIVNNVLTRFRS